MASTQRNSFLRFLAYVRPYWHLVLLAALGGILKFSIPLLSPQVTRHLVDRVFLNDGLARGAKVQELLFWVGGMAALFLFVYTPGVLLRHYCIGKASHRTVFDLRCDLYYKILRMSASFFDRRRSGEMTARLIGDIQQAQAILGTALVNVWMDSVALLLVLVFLLQIDLMVTLVALVTLPFHFFLFRRLGGRIRASSRDVQRELELISGDVTEKFAGSRIVQAFTRESFERHRFQEEATRLFSSSMRSTYWQSLNMACNGLLVGIAPLLVLLFGGYQVILGHLLLGELIAVIMYLGPLYLPLQRFAELNLVISRSMGSVERIFEIMDRSPTIVEMEGARDLPAIEGRVEFQEVSFSYDDRCPVLDKVSFRAEPGWKIGLVGPSGSGKSTIISLIPRFYDPREGVVRIDGHDVRTLKLRALRRHIGMVLQDPVLFTGTVRENILYGRPKATDQDLHQACRLAGALDFIESLPRGWDTGVGERGELLSGGQRQRITIARAFLKNPGILILDEATSALDSESADSVRMALERLLEGRTTFIIAHHMEMVSEADLILVLEQGRIVEQGRHEELLARDGPYRRLVSPTENLP